MILDSGEFGADGADGLAARGQLEAEQPLHGRVPGDVVGNGRDVVHAVGDDHVLVVIQVLAELLEPAVQIADVRRAGDDAFAVELEDEVERGVGGGVLWAEVEGPEVGVEVGGLKGGGLK